MISLIAAIGKNRELGYQGQLLFRLPGDMKFFRGTTSGHKVLMGRKTWESLPGKLQGRENIVVSRHAVEGADVSVADLGRFLRENADTEEEIFVIGGGMVYFETLPYAQRLYLTEVEASAEADTWFPEFAAEEWEREVTGVGEDGGVKYQFVKYERRQNGE